MQAGRSNRYCKTNLSNNICLLERDRTVCIKNNLTEGKNILTRFFLSDIYFYVLAAFLLSLFSSPMRNKERPVLLVDLLPFFFIIFHFFINSVEYYLLKMKKLLHFVFFFQFFRSKSKLYLLLKQSHCFLPHC